MSHSAHHPEDKGAAFAGLIGGAIFVAAIVVGTVVWTNGRFEAHGAEQAPAAVAEPSTN